MKIFQRGVFIAIAFGSILLSARAAEAQCAVGDEELAAEVLTDASIPELSAVEREQIILAVRESAHTDVTTVEEAFDRVDEGLINRITRRDSWFNQFYTMIEYGAGENSYGAVFYWGTAIQAAAIHDGFQEECGPSTINYDRGDTAPECQGFLTYANTASYGALDAYLPSNVAQAIVDARTADPFDSIASVMAVNGVAEVRLAQMLDAARTSGDVGASCEGIFDQIAVSATEADAMVAFVNEASAEELHGVLRGLIDETVVGYMLADRPYSTVAELSATYRVGPATFRTLRNAANYYRPFEELVAALNTINHPDAQVRIDQHFEWEPMVTDPGYGLTDMTCFGIDPALLPAGATDRPELADGDEVQFEVAQALAMANFMNELSLDPAPGLADLEHRTDGHDFFGCYISYHPNPWQYDYQTFFVDLDTGASILITFHYVE